MLLTVTITLDVIFDSQSRLHKRNLRKRGTENSDNKANKRKQTSGPALVFKLKEEDINTDIQAIRDVSHFLFTIVSFLTCKKKKGASIIFITHLTFIFTTTEKKSYNQ